MSSLEPEKKVPITADNELDTSSDDETLDMKSQSQQSLNSRLHIEMDNWKWRKATIFGADKKTELFRAECHMRSPQLRLRNLSSSFGREDTATIHCMSSDIDITLQGQAIKLKSRGVFKDGWTYSSPTGNGVQLTWKTEDFWNCFTLVCQDAHGVTLARGTLRKASMKTAGKIEILDERVSNNPAAVHEFALFGMAVMQARITVLAASGYGYYFAAASACMSKGGSSTEKAGPSQIGQAAKEKDKKKKEEEEVTVEVLQAVAGS